MDCQNVAKQLPAYFDDTLDPRTRNQIALHLEGCDRCQTEQADWAECFNRLKQVEVPDPGEPFWRDFTASVKRAIAKEAPPSQSVWEKAREEFQALFFPSIRWAMACATCAAVVIVVSYFTKPVRSSLSLKEAVHSAALSDPEEIHLVLDLMESDEADPSIDFMIEADL